MNAPDDIFLTRLPLCSEGDDVHVQRWRSVCPPGSVRVCDSLLRITIECVLNFLLFDLSMISWGPPSLCTADGWPFLST